MRIGCRVTASAVHAAPFLAVGPCRGVTPAHAADGRDARTAGVAGVQSPTCVRRVTSRPGNLGGRSKRSPRDGGRTLHGFQCAPGDRGPGKLAVADRLEFGTARGGFMPAIRDRGADRPPQPATSPGSPSLDAGYRREEVKSQFRRNCQGITEMCRILLLRCRRLPRSPLAGFAIARHCHARWPQRPWHRRSRRLQPHPPARVPKPRRPAAAGTCARSTACCRPEHCPTRSTGGGWSALEPRTLRVADRSRAIATATLAVVVPQPRRPAQTPATQPSPAAPSPSSRSIPSRRTTAFRNRRSVDWAVCRRTPNCSPDSMEEMPRLYVRPQLD